MGSNPSAPKARRNPRAKRPFSRRSRNCWPKRASGPGTSTSAPPGSTSSPNSSSCRRSMPPRSPRSSNTRRSKTCRSRWRKWFGITRFWASTAGGELEVLLVAIKADIVEGLFRVTDAAEACACNWPTFRRRRCATRSATITATWRIARCCWTSAPRPATCSSSKRARSFPAASISAPIPSPRTLPTRPS